MRRFSLFLLVVLASGCGGVAPLGALVQPPRFMESASQPAELRLFAPSPTMPTVSAGVRLWLEVENPNAGPFGRPTFGLMRLAAGELRLVR
jgi:hypothetical protein